MARGEAVAGDVGVALVDGDVRGVGEVAQHRGAGAALHLGPQPLVPLPPRHLADLQHGAVVVRVVVLVQQILAFLVLLSGIRVAATLRELERASPTLLLKALDAKSGLRAAANQKLGGEPIDNALAQRFWLGMRDQTDDFFVDARRTLAEGAALWRLSVPSGAPPLPLPGEQLIEWGGAQRWLWAPASAAVALRELAQTVGGHATLFRASAAHADVDKAAGINTPLDAVQQRIQQQLQKQFDPKGVFATGRMHPHTSAI